MAALVDRAKNILITPKTEWEVVAAETSPHVPVLTGYVLPLAAVAALAAFIGLVFVGTSFLGTTVRLGIGAGIAGLVMNIVMAVVMVLVLGFIIDSLAPTFGGQKNFPQAVKVAAYSYTPVWVVGVLAIVPALGLLGIVAAIYAVYLLFLGLPRVMKAPQDKAAGYTAVVVVVAIVVGFILAMVVGAVTAALSPAATFGSASGSTVTFDKDSTAGKLDDFAKKMEEATRKMEAAQKSGDANKQMEAALGALGTAMSGGKGVEPVQLDALKPFVPEKFAGLPRTSQNMDRSGVQGMMAAKIEAEYADQGGKRVNLEVTDTGGAAGLMGMASFMGVQGERETDERIERTRKEGSRLVHEEVSKKGGQNQYTVVLAERFVVNAEGEGVDINTLKSAVNSIDLGKLESLK
jgi:hypothetical protein